MAGTRSKAIAAVVAAIALAVLTTLVHGSWKGERSAARADEKTKRVASAQPVLAPVSGDPAGTIPTEAGIRAALDPLTKATALGAPPAVAVVDALTGKALYGANQERAATPASTTKITTAVAALTSPGPNHRIATRVVPGATPGTIVLVGGGDPTLTALDGKQYGSAYRAARLSDLAAATATALKASGTTQVKLQYDTTLYTGPALHAIGINENIAPVVSLMVDEGRVDPTVVGKESNRVQSPGIDAARKFAAALKTSGITVDGTPAPGTAPAGGAPELASVQSPPMSAMVEQMLTVSDNDLAEALLRQVAIANGQPASFQGGTVAARKVLEGLGVTYGTSNLKDGSGLDKENRLTPQTLVQTLAVAASEPHPELRWALTGLPIAGFTGTLTDRYGPNSGSADAAGVVRAKTGSLTGVSTLAGLVRDRDGRLLAFAILADKFTGDPDPARAAIDRMAAALADCGCTTG
ncbi:D-alanyl-D-alanine carboxypeptidase/D-alanyl-D-alanine endopeptidase [Embleya scabrispora]|uniref:D-alanyl-D-alanine carboxypeptidase/D-alanyl-D-alanine endopeptidase n=1 Tax=Embleya scabrispora TaxID=159449 RepID=UPI0005936E3F|nr:D-alanyl-D-alanine carboxypeptidase/D-alanyl-D-alanine-endopeptidase [Embleya scabrispora]MYS81236.1 D-alanyl-D-alanine carboxypeptidase/D-alanyl-D-alanine-endopeptidase [Streptomyces sp. SID5474]